MVRVAFMRGAPAPHSLLSRSRAVKLLSICSPRLSTPAVDSPPPPGRARRCRVAATAMVPVWPSNGTREIVQNHSAFVVNSTIMVIWFDGTSAGGFTTLRWGVTGHMEVVSSPKMSVTSQAKPRRRNPNARRGRLPSSCSTPGSGRWASYIVRICSPMFCIKNCVDTLCGQWAPSTE